MSDPTPPTTAHLINHTHWDREWFLTSIYTSRWIPGLIDKLEQLVAANPGYRFLLDGQTLVIEDLLAVAPEYAERVGALIGTGHLIAGPYYSQPDWRLTGGELLIRNLMLGQQDVTRYGGATVTGWLVDTFGHIGQSPQIHRLLGIEAVYVWRGVPRLEPYFTWQGADGGQLLTINLFGGYRNLYGVTHAPEVAVKRLQGEINKLRPFYPTADVPLFDGYDLEDDPEDPLRFYEQLGGVGPEVSLRESTPQRFAREVASKEMPLPVLSGELNSGKYGATFPGTLSTRTYLKVMARDCEQMLLHHCEPLAAMAWLKGRPYNAAQYEGWARLLLQNAVHDCICGVSVDQVHEKMEVSYRQTFEAMAADISESLAAILADFAPGDYAVSTNPCAAESWRVVGKELLQARTGGIGIWPVGERAAIEAPADAVSSFLWRNAHYEATISADGLVRVGQATLGALVVSAEHGDTYSGERGHCLGAIRPQPPLIVAQRSAHHCVVSFDGQWQGDQAQATARVELRFDRSPLIRWQIDLESRGTDLRIEMVFETGKPGDIWAGMPFDVVRRPVADRDLLPRELPEALDRVLLGQRELSAVSTFPFHDFVAVSDGNSSVAILAKGLRAYRAEEGGVVVLPLQRAVEWLTKADLEKRVGDAGPFFYVPDARCERRVRHEVAVAFGRFPASSMALQSLNAAYQNPPLIVRVRSPGSQTSWSLLHEELPLSSLQVREDVLLARFYNPTAKPHSLSQAAVQTDVWGSPAGEVRAIGPKEIVTVRLPNAVPRASASPADVEVLTPPPWRVGPNAGLPDPAVIAQLEEKIAALERQLAETEALLDEAEGVARLRLQHRIYVLGRERLEFQLSHLLNRRKLAQAGAPGYAYLYEPDPEIAALGLALNKLRIKRRIFDYVVQVL